MSDVEFRIGAMIVWTETGNACSCGGHANFGQRTLAAFLTAVHVGTQQSAAYDLVYGSAAAEPRGDA